MRSAAAAACHARLQRAWERVHVSASGRYSIARLLALAQYSDATSSARAFGLCALSATAPLAPILLLDALPLQDPAEGWRANTTVWVRSFASAFMLTLGVGVLFQVLVPKAQLPLSRVVGVAVLASSGYIGALLALAAHWVFPIPFTVLVGVPPWSLCFCAGMALAVGPRRIADDRELLAQMARFSNMMGFQATFLVIYPAYSAAFRSLSATAQLAFILVLPAVKFVLKRLLARILGDLDDLVPVIVISVDLFNALYQAKCMRTAGSWWTTLGILAIDVAQNAATLRRVLRDLREIERVAGAGAVRSSGGLLAYATGIVQELSELDRAKAFGSLQVQSYINLDLSATKATLLRSIVRKQIDEGRRRRRSTALQLSSTNASTSTSTSRTTQTTTAGFESAYREWLPLTHEVLRRSRILESEAGGLLSGGSAITEAASGVGGGRRSTRELVVNGSGDRGGGDRGGGVCDRGGGGCGRGRGSGPGDAAGGGRGGGGGGGASAKSAPLAAPNPSSKTRRPSILRRPSARNPHAVVPWTNGSWSDELRSSRGVAPMVRNLPAGAAESTRQLATQPKSPSRLRAAFAVVVPVPPGVPTLPSGDVVARGAAAAIARSGRVSNGSRTVRMAGGGADVGIGGFGLRGGFSSGSSRTNDIGGFSTGSSRTNDIGGASGGNPPNVRRATRDLSSRRLQSSGIVRQRRSAVLRTVLQLLWRCELALLVEYIEAAIPVVYVVSMCALHALPNAKFYPETADMTREQLRAALGGILAYAALELASLACVHAVLRRRLGFSALHQLAFVFATEWLLLQGVFVAWVIVVLQFTLAHFGVDFSFEFQWLRHS